MNGNSASRHLGALTPGTFALVTYLPDPLGAFLTSLRRRLPGQSHPQAHITFLPPRTLPLDLEAAGYEIERILRAAPPFEVELGSVRLFPETQVLYLDITAGAAELVELHRCLNQGPLFGEECFDYIPHLTLGGPLLGDDAAFGIRQAVEAWENTNLSRRFLVEEVVLLWQAENGSDADWTRISAHPLPSQGR